MNMYFVEFSFHSWMIVVCNLLNTTKGNIVTNVGLQLKISHKNQLKKPWFLLIMISTFVSVNSSMQPKVFNHASIFPFIFLIANLTKLAYGWSPL